MVTFGDNGQNKIIRIGKIQSTSSTFIDSVLLIKGLKHNLISISQLCDKGLKMSFKTSICIITVELWEVHIILKYILIMNKHLTVNHSI